MNIPTIRCLALVAVLAGSIFVSGDALAKATAPAQKKPAPRLQVRVEKAPDSATLARWLKQNSQRVQNQRMARVRALGLAPDAAAGQPTATQAKTGVQSKTGAATPAVTGQNVILHRARTQEQVRKGQPEDPKGAGAGKTVQAGEAKDPLEDKGPGAAKSGGPAKSSQATSTASKAQTAAPAPRSSAARPDPMASLKDVLKAGRSGAESPSEKALRERLRLEQRRREQLKNGAGGGGNQGGQGPHRGSSGR